MSLIYKTKKVITRLSGGLALALVLAFTLAPGGAFAESKTYALDCGPNAATVINTNGVLSCQGGSAPNEAVSIAAKGSDPSKYPSSANAKTLTIVSVDCGSGSVKTFKTGDASFSCTKGKTPKVTTKQTISAQTPVTKNAAPPVGCSESSCDLISEYINPAINLFSIMFGIVVVGSIIMGAIQYITSEGDPQKTSKAKNRMANTVLSIFAYAALYGFLQFVIPGGFFSK